RASLRIGERVVRSSVSPISSVIAFSRRSRTEAKTGSMGRVSRRGGPRYGPPHPPSLGRAPAQPWRASGLTQDVSSSLHHERAVPIDLEGEARRHHDRSEEHTSELQSRGHLVCRLLLEKKKNGQ